MTDIPVDTDPVPLDGPAPLGILGGTFDPVHIGHLRLAVEAREKLGLSGVRLIPNATPPHRALPQSTTADRLDWLRAAVAGEAGLSVDEREYRRDGPSYTVETLQSLREEMPRTPLCLLMGADSFNGLPGWHRWRRLLELAHIVVVPRPGVSGYAPEVEALLANAGVTDGDALRARLSGAVHVCEITPLRVSASDIRRRLQAGLSIRYLVPERVWQDLQE